MPDLQTIYDKNTRGQNYEEAQRQITIKGDYAQAGKPIPLITIILIWSTSYFIRMA